MCVYIYIKGPVVKKGKGKKNETIFLVFLKANGKGNANSRKNISGPCCCHF